MRTAALLRATLAVSIVSALASAGCGGKAAPTTPGNTGGTPAGAERPPGTTGFPGLDWGAGVDEITALYPAAETNDRGLAVEAEVEHRPASIQFVMDGDGLQEIRIGWGQVFPSMEVCGDDLHLTRGAIDARLGQGAEENLGVFWETPTSSVALVCDPGDDGSALLQQSYQRKVAEVP